jgi:3'(2'), 5'-bisphosphate nucleotidase
LDPGGLLVSCENAEADFYPRFGTTMEWDTAAGQAVLEAAGGHIFGLDGNALRYGTLRTLAGAVQLSGIS